MSSAEQTILGKHWDQPCLFEVVFLGNAHPEEMKECYLQSQMPRLNSKET